MPPIEVTCSNPDCGEKFQVGSEKAGELVECPSCGASVYVLEPDGAGDELELSGVPKAKNGEKGHIAHPARQQCPNCGAVLGVRDAFCPECGADIRTGAAVTATVERKKLNLAPFLIGGGILVALVALIALIVFAVQIIGARKAKAAAALEAAKAAAAPAVQAAAPAPAPVKPAYEIPEKVLSELASRELTASQNVDAYMAQLRRTLAAVKSAQPQERAAQWAALHEFCKGKGLQAEADQAWYEAARQGASDQDVNQKLGLTASYQGVAVTPAQKEFLDGLKPLLRVVNHDPTLKDDAVVIEGQAPVSIPLGKMVEITPPAGELTVKIARADRPDRTVEAFQLSVEPGVVQTVEIYNALAAPSVPYQPMSAIYMALQRAPGAAAATEQGPGRGPTPPQPTMKATVERDATDQATSASAGEVHVQKAPDGPLAMQLSSGQLIVRGVIPMGHRFDPSGLQLLSGSRDYPLSLAVPADGTSPLRLVSGAYCVVHADLADGLWAMLGAIDGDLAYEHAQSALQKRISDVAFENSRKEAAGELFGPWQTQPIIYEAAAALNKQLQQAMGDQSAAYPLPQYRDRAALLDRSAVTGSIYLNWPRFRRALALALSGVEPALKERFDLGRAAAAAPAAAAPAAARGPVGRGPGAFAMAAFMGAAPAGRAAAGPANPDAEPFEPVKVASSAQTRRYTSMRLLPLLPDDAVLQTVKDSWDGLSGQDRMAALMAVEQVATPQAVDWLGQTAQNATDTDETAMALLSLGAIGTPQALAQTQMPGVSPKVHAASLVASVIAGDPDAIDHIPDFVTNASPDERAAFLQYLTQFDTPGALLGDVQAVEAFSDPASQAALASAFIRIGGQAAMGQLSHLMSKSKQTYADRLGAVRKEDALLLLRQVGTAVAGQKKPDAHALNLLAEEGSPAAIQFLLASAINQGDSDALPVLCKMGTADALAAAGQISKDLTFAELSDLHKQWLAPRSEGPGSAWAPGVDGDAAGAFLAKVFADGSADAKVRIAAATMLSEVGKTVPPDKLLEFASSAGAPAGAGGPGAPAGFQWPDGELAVPQGFTFDASPSFYAIGLALEANDPALGGALQSFAGSTDNGPLKGAAMVALGRIGGDENLKFLRDTAAKSQPTYADGAELAKVLEDRLAAMDGLAAAHDAAFLPRTLDMLKEEPPPQSAVAKADDYSQLAAWWQITLWRGAADCAAGICSQRSPLELTADSGLQSMLTDRLKELIDNPGPKAASLDEARQMLSEAAVRAFGRVADFSDSANAFVLQRMVTDLSQQAAPNARAARGFGGPARAPMGMSTGRGFGGPRGGTPAASHPDSLRIAVLDALAHAGARASDPADFVDFAGTLAATAALKDAYEVSLRKMAKEPTGGYFALLASSLGSLDGKTRTALFEATKSSPQARGEQYGTFLAALVSRREAAGPAGRLAQGAGRAGEAAAGAAPASAEEAEAQGMAAAAAGRSAAMAAAESGAQRGREIGMAMAARAAAAAAASHSRGPGMPGRGRAAGGPTGQSGVNEVAMGTAPGYDRRLPYKLTDWEYQPSPPTDLQLRWAVIQRLVEASGADLAAVVRRAHILTSADVGPAVAPALVQQDASAQDDVISQLGDLLAPESSAQPGPRAGRGPAAPSAAGGATASDDARRAAVDSLRRIGGDKAAEALYTGLVGRPVPKEQTGPAAPGMPPPGAMEAAMRAAMARGPIPGGAMRGMQRSLLADADQVSILIARALGGMGKQDALRNALNAQGRERFAADAASVQTAALLGMAYLPGSDDPVNLLGNFVRQAGTEQLREAAAAALVTAARLSSNEG